MAPESSACPPAMKGAADLMIRATNCLSPKEEQRSWPVAVLASLLVHGLLISFIWWRPGTLVAPGPEKEKLQVLRISFHLPAPPNSLPSALPKESSAPVRQPGQGVSHPQSIARSAASQTESIPGSATGTQTAALSPSEVSAPPNPPPESPPVAPASNALEGLRQRYLAGLAVHLEAHKFYPDAARKRGLAGTVQVAFEMRANGETGELQLSGGHKMLHQAAAETVRRALPLPPPPKEISVPLSVRYGMTFALQ